MGKLLGFVIGFVISGIIARVMTALGVGFFTYYGITEAFDSLFAALVSAFGAADSSVLSLFLLAGGGEALDIMLSCMAGVLSVKALQTFVGAVS